MSHRSHSDISPLGLPRWLAGLCTTAVILPSGQTIVQRPASHRHKGAVGLMKSFMNTIARVATIRRELNSRRLSMATADYWAEPKVVREQIVLFAPSLDSMIPDDHEVRLLDETLRTLDWSEWEAHYPRLRGQPPIHPRVLAGLWLYAMMRRIRTSRPVEYACGHNIDFLWLAEGHTPDHSTLAEFFSKHQPPL